MNKTTVWRNRGDKALWQVIGDFGYAHKMKASLIPPLHVGVGQEYWQSLSYLPSTARAGSDKIKARVQDGKTQAVPRAWGKSLRRLNRHRCMQGMHPPKQTKPRENDPKHWPFWEQPKGALILECEYKFGNSLTTNDLEL